MSAEEDIRKTIARFANSFDLKDWALMESALAEVLTVDTASGANLGEG